MSPILQAAALNVLVFSFWKQAYVCQTIVDSFFHFIGIACIAYKQPSLSNQFLDSISSPPFIFHASLVLLSDQDTCRFYLRQFELASFLYFSRFWRSCVVCFQELWYLISIEVVHSKQKILHPFSWLLSLVDHDLSSSWICSFVNVELHIFVELQ